MGGDVKRAMGTAIRTWRINRRSDRTLEEFAAIINRIVRGWLIDLVSRKWIATLVTQEESSTQVEVIFDAALEAEGLSAEIERRALSVVEHDAELPILLAVSDNGPQMTSGTTA
ncbi:MAG: hypothetical protein LC808_10260, partial [Actinobacteria bacterium]|nr:hypothetical protein [Actinomycetota bacterium]